MTRHECSHWKFKAPLQTAPLVTHTWQKPYTPQAICPWDQVSSINKLTWNRSAESLQGAQQFALSLPTGSLCLPEKLYWKTRDPCLLVWGIQPKAWRERHLPAPALSTHNSHRRRVINSLPRGNAKRSCNDNDPPSMELLLLGTMELPWYLSLAGNIGIKWAWAQLCVNDIYKQIRFVYLYWMQTH